MKRLIDNVDLSYINALDESLTGEIMLKGTDECIGTFEFYVKNNNLISAINIYPDYQNKGLGYFVFSNCYKKLSERVNIESFTASWSTDAEYSHLPKGQSINLSIFFENLRRGMDEQTAIWSTPTGKWLSKNGFTDAKPLKRESDCVVIFFTK